MLQEAKGLYDPKYEHDACGLAFIAHLRGNKSRTLVEDALRALESLDHRGACGCDPETGDGAGIMLQLPHRFFKRVGLALGFTIPRRRRYAVGQIFLPRDRQHRQACQEALERAVKEVGQRVIGWRDVPVRPERIGRQARESMPMIKQLYIERRRVIPTEFERLLFVIRRLAELEVAEKQLDPNGSFYVASLSAETIVYKGLLRTDQLRLFYDDLSEPDFVSGIALVHSRFSTNTAPQWGLAQPFRRICHNGEINTVRGNYNWMQARRSVIRSAKFVGGLDRLQPILDEYASDSAQFDRVIELLNLGGRSLPHAMMMMIPEAWENDKSMDPARQAFYEYSSALMEPWDGPAAIIFCDGHTIGATLDRNGLRPARYCLTHDEHVILASEVGAFPIAPDQVSYLGRLQPGKMLLVDTISGRLVSDEEAKGEIVSRYPYARWLSSNQVALSALNAQVEPVKLDQAQRLVLSRAHGYSEEDLQMIIEPMVLKQKEAIGSMGNDTSLAVFSDQSPVLYRYFKQLFAQVTNPPIDPIREREVMSIKTNIGPGANPLDETPEQCHRLTHARPLLTEFELEQVKQINEGLLEATTLSILFEVDKAGQQLQKALDQLCLEAERAIDEGYSILILSDRGLNTTQAAIPALLATAAVHHHLIQNGIRLCVGLVIETAEAREVHHFALLLGYGASAVCPYLALDHAREIGKNHQLSADVAVENYLKATDEGLLKVMSKMGISTLASYRGAQIFEALGLSTQLTKRYFCGTSSRVEGIGVEHIAQETLQRHQQAFQTDSLAYAVYEGSVSLPSGGLYRWRRRGERHSWNPSTISLLQDAVRRGDEEVFQRFVSAVDDESRSAFTLRSLIDLVPIGPAIDLDEVEPAVEIVQRFCTGAMSLGSISANAHETLAIAMNQLGAKSNSGEGGEESHRSQVDELGQLRSSAIRQVASGRFGVDIKYLSGGREIQIKIAQGAKPGEGGQLPGHKVTDRIAQVRCSTPGVTLISPPPHHDIYSIEDLAQLIYDLKCAHPQARLSVKLVSEVGVGTVAAGVAKAKADAIVVAGDGGGTGASPLSSLHHCGLPWELGLAETQQTLVKNGLRGRIRLQVDGGLRSPRDVLIAAALGAEEFGFSTAPLVSLGCIMLRKCHLNTCSVGIATQDPQLIKRFAGEPIHVVRYFLMLAEAIRIELARLGARSLDEWIGQTQGLKTRQTSHWKAQHVSLASLLTPPSPDPIFYGPAAAALRYTVGQESFIDNHQDWSILERLDLFADHFDNDELIQLNRQISNTDRAVGTILSGELTRRQLHGIDHPPLLVRFSGRAGQSFGALLKDQVHFTLEGEANDYLGKGLSGGTITVIPPPDAGWRPSESISIGNVALYGATAGSVFIVGRAGERFAVRNSGALAVVEGVGDHGCEYMTGGEVVVLGPTGRNFAAGMSGGFAYIYDEDASFAQRCNTSLVTLESQLEPHDQNHLKDLILRHIRETGSQKARQLINDWENAIERFVKVIPLEYQAALNLQKSRGA